MRFVFGPYTHDIGSVFISRDERQRVRSPRGRTLSVKRTLTIGGDLTADTQSTITSAINLLVAGYSIEGGGAGLLQDSGAPSAHYLPVAGSLAGVQVVSGPGFGTTNGNGEYATGRSFNVTLEAEYPAALTDPILSYSETVQIRGHGGPRLVVHETDTGAPFVEMTRQRTPVQVSQRGNVVGYLERLPPNPPLYPDYLSAEGYNVGFDSAQQQTLLRRTGFGTSWSYDFILPASPGNVFPLER
jgi:hypothetical protein